MKQRIRLTETDLHRIIKESVKKILNEVHDNGHVVTLKTNNQLNGQKGMIVGRGDRSMTLDVRLYNTGQVVRDVPWDCIAEEHSTNQQGWQDYGNWVNSNDGKQYYQEKGYSDDQRQSYYNHFWGR